jgi:alpha-beta hydrolase superfamily lysophospholipase
MSWLPIALRGLAVSALVAALIPPALILSARPLPDPRAADGPGIVFDSGTALAPLPELQTFTARDGARLGYRRWDSGAEEAALLVMVHGSGWHGGQFARLAARIAQGGHADVVAPDLRGHGPDPARRGDIEHIGQLEEDLADLVAASRGSAREVVMLGHSSGGGLVVRLAGGAHAAVMDRAILLAPYLGHNAPTTRPDSGGWARPLVRRIIGLTMLDRVGITAFHHLTSVQFLFPSAVLDGPLGDTATRAYSFRLMTSFAPRNDFAADIAGLPPFLLLAGEGDEAFVPTGYAPLMSGISDRGRYELIPGAGHLGIVDHAGTAAAIIDFLAPDP